MLNWCCFVLSKRCWLRNCDYFISAMNQPHYRNRVRQINASNHWRFQLTLKPSMKFVATGAETLIHSSLRFLFSSGLLEFRRSALRDATVTLCQESGSSHLETKLLVFTELSLTGYQKSLLSHFTHSELFPVISQIACLHFSNMQPRWARMQLPLCFSNLICELLADNRIICRTVPEIMFVQKCSLE